MLSALNTQQGGYVRITSLIISITSYQLKHNFTCIIYDWYPAYCCLAEMFK